MISEQALGKTEDEIRALFPNACFTLTDMALDDTYVEMTLSADDGSYLISLDEDDRASFVSLWLKGCMPSYMGLIAGMERTDVIQMLGEPDEVFEPKSMIVFGGELGAGMLVYDRGTYVMEVAISFSNHQVRCVSLLTKNEYQESRRRAGRN